MELGAEIARKKGLAVFNALRGFESIGEKITQFEQAFASKDETRMCTFVLGYEETCGYLAGLREWMCAALRLDENLTEQKEG